MIYEKESSICEGQVTVGEIVKAIQQMSNGKSPGTDGLTVEFFKVFHKELKEPLLESYNYSFDYGLLSIEQRRGIINLIPKPGKDLRELRNWRPITLLSTDYKMLTKILASRLQQVLLKIISNCQTGYIKGRQIGCSIRTIEDIYDCCYQRDISGLMLIADFEKVFDSLNF